MDENTVEFLISPLFWRRRGVKRPSNVTRAKGGMRRKGRPKNRKTPTEVSASPFRWNDISLSKWLSPFTPGDIDIPNEPVSLFTRSGVPLARCAKPDNHSSGPSTLRRSDPRARTAILRLRSNG